MCKYSSLKWKLTDFVISIEAQAQENIEMDEQNEEDEYDDEEEKGDIISK
jgi:hypothetical protein